jgi:hypothetical protein
MKWLSMFDWFGKRPLLRSFRAGAVPTVKKLPNHGDVAYNHEDDVVYVNKWGNIVQYNPKEKLCLVRKEKP